VLAGTLERAVARAAEDALASRLRAPVVLLSPACASFDQFPNFEIRGDAFRDAVHRIVGVTSAEERGGN
jgi:UDP-N-acetylmuramoylalanine--D-glutamate ligase